MRAVQIKEFGGPEVLELVELPDPVPAEGEVLVEISRAGMNFADTHKRGDVYLAKAGADALPLIPGNEISGRTPDGRRVAAILPSGAGGYAERVAVPEEWLVPIPDGVDDDAAAAILIQGLTAWGLLRISGHLREGETVVVEGAAGGTGSLCVQLAKSMGARVIALASSPEKRELAKRLGADAAVDSRSERIGEEILAANDGGPVDVILQMSGGAAFTEQIKTLAPFGRMVVFGIATREPNEYRTSWLMKASQSIAGFWIPHLLERPDLLEQGIPELLGAVASEALEVVVGGVFPLSDAARAQTELAERRTHGKLLLDPST